MGLTVLLASDPMSAKVNCKKVISKLISILIILYIYNRKLVRFIYTGLDYGRYISVSLCVIFFLVLEVLNNCR